MVMQTDLHKKNELDYFFVEESYGGNQDLFPEIAMRDGGCGAVAACESCIYFARRAGKYKLYPHKLTEIAWEEYHDFAYIMKHYLCPRPNGIRYPGIIYGRFWRISEGCKRRNARNGGFSRYPQL